VLRLFGEHPQPNAGESYLAGAHLLRMEHLAAAEQLARQSLVLARQYDRVIDRFVISQVFLGALK